MDMVHENLKNLKLEVPPDDTTLTLRDAINLTRALIKSTIALI
jgi:hypothetical protein